MTVYWITGGTGLIDRHLAQRLVQAKQQFVVLSRSAGTRFQAHQPAGLLAFDFDLAGDSLQSLPDGEDDVVLIALTSHVTTSRDLSLLRSILQIDIIGCLRLLESLRPRLRYVVYTSSCTVYGWPDQLPVPESAPYQPANVYALSKTAMEMLLQQVREQWGLPIAVLRIAQVYGPGADPAVAIYRFLHQAHRGGTPLIRMPPDTIRDYCHVSDAVEAMLLAIQKRVDATLNIGSGDPISLEELARLCLSVAQSDKKPIVQVDPQAGATNMWLDISRAQDLIGYDPKVRVRTGVESEYLRLYGNSSPNSVRHLMYTDGLEES